MSFEFKRAKGKTAVFSGTRQHCDFVPKLEDLCIQKLLDNVNRIECVGDVPYYVLRPLLTKISLSQLKRIEDYNPQLIDDDESDEPWKAHCERHYEGRRPEGGEKWRDLFMRCEKEQDHKLERIAKRIKRHEKKATPARQVRVVDQQPHSSGRSRAVSSSTVITQTIKNHVTKKSSNGQPATSTVVIRREIGPAANVMKAKAKQAPLMAKSMQLFKSRFRR